MQTNEDNIFQDFGSCGVNLMQPQQEQFDSFNGNLEQVCSSFRGGNNGVVYSSSIGSAQLDLAASFSGVLQQETHQVCGFRGQNDDSAVPHLQQQQGQVFSGVVEINSSSSVGAVKEEFEEECSGKRRRTGSCSKPGTKACREKLRREKLNDKYVQSFLYICFSYCLHCVVLQSSYMKKYWVFFQVHGLELCFRAWQDSKDG
jgi:hypothetical protein